MRELRQLWQQLDGLSDLVATMNADSIGQMVYNPALRWTRQGTLGA